MPTIAAHGVDDVFGGGHLGDVELIVGHHSIKKGAGIFEDLQIEGNTFWLNRTSPQCLKSVVGPTGQRQVELRHAQSPEFGLAPWQVKR
jgi:hypothetical protein